MRKWPPGKRMCIRVFSLFWKRGRHTKNLQLDRKNLPPFLNLSTRTMPGERWRDVPGYEGLYKVSSLGSVKALQKITGGNKRQWIPEQIQRITVDFRLDKHGREIPGSTFACMAKNGRKKMISIPRLVHYLFVRKFDLSDSSRRIYYKDGNPLNARSKNLFWKVLSFRSASGSDARDELSANFRSWSASPVRLTDKGVYMPGHLWL